MKTSQENYLKPKSDSVSYLELLGGLNLSTFFFLVVSIAYIFLSSCVFFLLFSIQLCLYFTFFYLVFCIFYRFLCFDVYFSLVSIQFCLFLFFFIYFQLLSPNFYLLVFCLSFLYWLNIYLSSTSQRAFKNIILLRHNA